MRLNHNVSIYFVTQFLFFISTVYAVRNQSLSDVQLVNCTGVVPLQCHQLNMGQYPFTSINYSTNIMSVISFSFLIETGFKDIIVETQT